jgi:asparagine synthase (glutamine-hydrolysing)
MCGIVGWIDLTSSTPLQHLRTANSAVRHRGPDDEGYWILSREGRQYIAKGRETNTELSELANIDDLSISPKVALAHRRLSIVDTTTAGHQPLVAYGIALVFNGEIYNHKDLRKDLSASWAFKGASDSEVVLAAYLKWGLDCFRAFDGMWAIAIVDQRKNRVYLSRDRLGEKPLYVEKNESRVCFASEIKSLIVSSLVRFEPEREAVADFIFTAQNHYSNNQRETMFKRVFEVEPGSICSIDMDTLATKTDKYWNISESSNSHSNSIDIRDAAINLRNIVERSVATRLSADVPVAVTLSGGLDSSIVAATAAKIKGKDSVVCYTSEGEPDDPDVYYSKILCKFLGVEQRWVSQRDGLAWNVVDELIWAYDEPPKDLGGTALGGLNVYRAAANDGYKVLLEGVGPDELLAGYSSYFGPYFLREYLARGNLAQGYSELVQWMDHDGRDLPWLLKKSTLKFAGQIFKNSNLLWLKKIISSNTAAAMNFSADASLTSRALGRVSRSYRHTRLDEAKEYFIFHENFPSYLRYADRNGMMFSIEGRQPFLSKDFIEFTFKLPLVCQLNNGYGKFLLRKAFEGELPAEILWRKRKQGFTFPEAKWIDYNKEKMLTVICGSMLLKEYINVSKLFNYILSTDVSSMNREQFGFVWRCYSVAVWSEKFGNAI